jgi:hypothetical protein
MYASLQPTHRMSVCGTTRTSGNVRLESEKRSWLCENSSGRATRRNISEQLHLWESNHTAQATFDALPENCVFYISRMYEFLHRLGHPRPRRSSHTSLMSASPRKRPSAIKMRTEVRGQLAREPPDVVPQKSTPGATGAIPLRVISPGASYGSPAMARASPVSSKMCMPVLARSTT